MNTNKKRIMFCMNTLMIGGLEIMLLRTLSLLVKKYDITVCVRYKVTEKIFTDFFTKHNIKLICWNLGKKPRFFPLRLWWKHKNRLFEQNVSKMCGEFDVIIDFQNFNTLRSLKNVRRPKIGWFHGSAECFKDNFSDIIEDIFTTYDVIVVLTDGFIRDFEKLYPLYAKKIVRIYNSINTEEIIQKSDAGEHPKNEQYFTFVGRIEKDKDILTVLKAFKKFAQKIPSVKLYLIGEGTLRKELEDYVIKSGLADRIIFTGNLNNPFGYVKHTLANILSSPSEGLPNVLLEAQALDTLCISSDCPNGPREILMNGKAGFLFPVGDDERLSEIMIALCLEKIDPTEMIALSKEQLKRFSTETIFPQLVDLIEKEIKDNA